MDATDLIRKIKLARKYILDQEYEQAYNETYLPPEIEKTNSLPVEAQVKPEIAEWISVKDRLPENHNDVLVFSDYGDHTDVWVSRVDKYWGNNSVTHWMPLPESPDVKEK